MKLKQALWHFGRQVFHCEKDAIQAFEVVKKEYKLHTLEGCVMPVKQYAGRGKPKAGVEKVVIGYRMEAEYRPNKVEIDKILNRKGRFILATNDLDTENYRDEQILDEYKEQQKVEGGFRFLKDPWFMVDSIFLKTPKRIEALMAVMTLCLMIYNVGQYRIRQQLSIQAQTLPNQLGKQVSNPTLRWIFQIMEGVGLVFFYDQSLSIIIREVITNLNELRRKIIRLFGDTAAYIYGLIPKKPKEGLGM